MNLRREIIIAGISYIYHPKFHRYIGIISHYSFPNSKCRLYPLKEHGKEVCDLPTRETRCDALRSVT
jgi:hypothetical protein